MTPVPLATAAIIAAIAIAATAVCVVLVVSMRRLSARAQQALVDAQRNAADEIATEVRPIAAATAEMLRRMTRDERTETPPPMSMGHDEDVETYLDRLRARIDAGPYVRRHVRPDLPAEVDEITWEGPHGPVTVTRGARQPARRRARGYRGGLLALPLLPLTLVWRGLTASPGVAVSAASVGAIALAPGALPDAETPRPAIVERGPDRDMHPMPTAPAVPAAGATPTPTPTPTRRPTATAPTASSPTPSPTAETSPTSTPDPTPPARPDGADDDRPGRGHGRPDGPDHPRHNHGRGRGR